jgi:hypothetical protein
MTLRQYALSTLALITGLVGCATLEPQRFFARHSALVCEWPLVQP